MTSYEHQATVKHQTTQKRTRTRLTQTHELTFHPHLPPTPRRHPILVITPPLPPHLIIGRISTMNFRRQGRHEGWSVAFESGGGRIELFLRMLNLVWSHILLYECCWRPLEWWKGIFEREMTRSAGANGETTRTGKDVGGGDE